MILKNTNEDLLYLLAHLHTFKKKEEDSFVPGEVVALTGSTGNSTGIHLHVEVFLCVEKDREKILDLLYIHGGGTARDRFFANSDLLNTNRVDPFNHNLSTHRV
ncbi:MAG: M23 family metallopeptidase [Treponema sp.]|jgi:murein DD-endopeptidase MepM/ murein hydrolase activator NlpD|nr:M23 family metallopeptidase [Treponema sp.]